MDIQKDLLFFVIKLRKRHNLKTQPPRNLTTNMSLLSICWTVLVAKCCLNIGWQFPCGNSKPYNFFFFFTFFFCNWIATVWWSTSFQYHVSDVTNFDPCLVLFVYLVVGVRFSVSHIDYCKTLECNFVFNWLKKCRYYGSNCKMCLLLIHSLYAWFRCVQVRCSANNPWRLESCNEFQNYVHVTPKKAY